MRAPLAYSEEGLAQIRRSCLVRNYSEFVTLITVDSFEKYFCRAPPNVELEIELEIFAGKILISPPSCTYTCIYYPGRAHNIITIVAWLYRVRTIELVHVEDPFNCSAFTSTDRPV